jgi:hypothetical protein
VPALLLLVLETFGERRRSVVPLAMVLAAAWLTNAPAAVMIHYSTALLILYFAWRTKSVRPLLVGAGAVALGAALAAFYLLPAIYEQRWIDITQAVAPGSRPEDSFLWIHTGDRDHDAFNHIVSGVAILEMSAILLAAWLGRAWRKTRGDLWNALLGWAAAASLMMFPFTLVLWKVLPKMQYMQFPWRWLLCLSMIFTLFVTLGLRRWWQRAAVCALSIAVILTAWVRVQAPWWDTAADLNEMQDAVVTGAGYEGTDEYTPLGADPGAIDKDARKVTVDGPAHAAIRVLRWDAENKEVAIEMSAPDQLALRLFPYPAWKVTLNGSPVGATGRARTGQMLVPAVAGVNQLGLTFARTWDRTAGGWISLIALLSLPGWPWLAGRFRPRP